MSPAHEWGPGDAIRFFMVRFALSMVLTGGHRSFDEMDQSNLIAESSITVRQINRIRRRSYEKLELEYVVKEYWWGCAAG